MRASFLAVLSLLCLGPSLLAQTPAVQTWTASDGRALQARFVGLEGDSVVLDKNGTRITLPLGRLNAESVAQAKALAAGAPAALPAAASSGPALKRMTADFSKPFTNSLGMKFVPVRGTGLLVCIHETRRKDYAAFAAAVPGVDEKWKSVAHKPAGASSAVPSGDQDDHPACAVNYADAEAFCEWISKGEGLRYRLPTGPEWCEAAGLGDVVKVGKDGSLVSAPPAKKNPFEYLWGADWPPPAGTANYGDSAYAAKFPGVKSIAGYTDGFVTTAPVMSFKPNKLGIYDVAGNVAEWCDKVFEGEPPTSTVGALRGRDFRTENQYYFRPLSTEPMPRAIRAEFIGFRVVVEKVR